MGSSAVENGTRRAVRDGVFDVLVYCGIGSIIVTIFLNWRTPYDDTDFNGIRSGMEVLTDCRTGLQYLSTREGGVTPRLDVGGNHIVEKCK